MKQLFLAALAALLLGPLLFFNDVRAEPGVVTMNVTTVADELNSDGDCSLREAIRAANLNQAVDACPAGAAATRDIIVLPASIITLSVAGADDNAAVTGDLDIIGLLNIVVRENGQATIRGGSGWNDRILHLHGTANVLVDGITIQGGSADFGSGIRVEQNAILTFEEGTIRSNQASASGGGLANFGTAKLTFSTVSGNGTGQDGGGILNGGTLVLVNTTVSDNRARANGGGISNLSGATLNLANATIAGNTADLDLINPAGDGGGVRNLGTATAKNTIIAGNTDLSSSIKHPDCSGVLTSGGHNLIGNNTGCSGFSTRLPQDLVGTAVAPVNPRLSPLTDNLGLRLTRALAPDSPAIDRGNPAGCTDENGQLISFDQRRFARPVDGDDNDSSICDIGAYEVQAFIVVNTVEDQANTDTSCSLREAIRAVNRNEPVSGCRKGGRASVDTIRLPRGTYTLSRAGAGEDSNGFGDLDVVEHVNLIGAGMTTTIIQGGTGWTDRVFHVPDLSILLEMSGLTVRGGNPDADGGGILCSGGFLTLTSVLVTENSARRGGGILTDCLTLIQSSFIQNNNATASHEGSGGGIFSTRSLTIRESFVSGNAANGEFGDGGGIYSSGGRAVIENSSVTSNRVGISGAGGGVANIAGSLTITDTRFDGNNTGLADVLNVRGGAIHNTGALTLTGGVLTKNHAMLGGAIFNSGTAIASRVTLSENAAIGVNARGGAIDNQDTFTLTTSTVRANSAGTNDAGNGGGIFNNGTMHIASTTLEANESLASGGGVFNAGTLRLDKSTLHDNEAQADPTTIATRGGGGGIANTGALTATNATLSGNRAAGSGGGLLTTGSFARLNNTTITANIGDSDSDGHGTGGGLFSSSAAATRIANSIVADNSLLTNAAGRDCSGAVGSEGYNLVETSAGCSFVVTTGDQLGDGATAFTAELLPLARYPGSPVPMHALDPSSLAVDAGNPAPPGSQGAACEAKDERDAARAADGNFDGVAVCDIGAYEFVPIRVTQRADNVATDSLCSLREAIQAANGDTLVEGGNICDGRGEPDIIFLPSGTYTLTRSGANEDAATTGDLDITGTLVIRGPTASLPFVTGGGAFGDRIFHILPGADVTLALLRLRDGAAGEADGGAILNEGGNVRLDKVDVRNNSAHDGGGIFSTGGLIVVNSEIAGNTANRNGGGIHNAAGGVRLVNSTINGNKARGSGGGLFATSSNVDSLSIRLTNVTLTTNTSDVDADGDGNGGGLFVSPGSVVLSNSILALNLDEGGGQSHPDCSGSLVSDGFNLIRNTTGCVLEGSTQSDKLGADPKLDSIRFNGGPTRTRALLAGSPAIDGGNPSGCGEDSRLPLTTDQRGSPRPLDGNGDGSAICDIGAFELGVGNVGISELLPSNGASPPGVVTTFTLSWTHPVRWRALQDLDLRLRAGEDVALWVRFTEGMTSTFSLLDADGSLIGTGLPGENGILESDTGTLHLDQSGFQGTGAEGPSVVVSFTFSLKPAAEGRAYSIDLLATDDDGNLEGPDIVGTWTVGELVPSDVYLPLIQRH